LVSLTISVVKGSFAEARLQHSPWDANHMAVKTCCSSCFAASLIVRRSRNSVGGPFQERFSRTHVCRESHAFSSGACMAGIVRDVTGTCKISVGMFTLSLCHQWSIILDIYQRVSKHFQHQWNKDFSGRGQGPLRTRPHSAIHPS
jgi:hypothetical protein